MIKRWCPRCSRWIVVRDEQRQKCMICRGKLQARYEDIIRTDLALLDELFQELR